MTSSGNPSIVGAAVTYTATVTGIVGSGQDPLPNSPTGKVVFKDGATTHLHGGGCCGQQRNSNDFHCAVHPGCLRDDRDTPDHGRVLELRRKLHGIHVAGVQPGRRLPGIVLGHLQHHHREPVVARP